MNAWQHVLHDWSDEQCVKALAKCKKAIPSREAGGKVIVIDVVVGSSSGPMYEAELLMDMAMMCTTTGQEGGARVAQDFHGCRVQRLQDRQGSGSPMCHRGLSLRLHFKVYISLRVWFGIDYVLH